VEYFLRRRRVRKHDIVHASAVERLTHLGDLGVTHFVMDFGHPLQVEPVLPFAEQVIAPMKAS
jgi:hypothetical protein